MKSIMVPVGTVFGQLTVDGEAPTAVLPSGTTKRRLMVRCACGNTTIVQLAKLRSGETKSCGCYRRVFERVGNRKHGYSHGKTKAPEYGVWNSIVQRCTNPRHQAFADYGGRGISVCAEWRYDFVAFFNHVGPRPSPVHSIDRVNNNGNYEPGNVRWATAVEQAHNRRTPAMRAS